MHRFPAIKRLGALARRQALPMPISTEQTGYLMPYFVAAIRSGSRFATLGVPRPVTASQPVEAE